MKSLNPRIQSLKEMLSLEEKRSKLQTELDTVEQRMAALKHVIFSANATPQAAEKTKSLRAPAISPTRKRSPRGQLKDQIMAALEAAGSSGVRVKDLAEAIGTKPVNIHSWFHSNVKSNPAIKKVSGGHYSLANGTQPSPATPPKAAKAPKAARTKAGGKSAKRGELSARILAHLQSAGDEGITVADLARKLDAKYKNTYIWFATTGKKNPAIEKVGPATYKYVG